MMDLEAYIAEHMPAIAARENAACRPTWGGVTWDMIGKFSRTKAEGDFGGGKRAMVDFLEREGPADAATLAKACGIAFNTVLDYGRDLQAGGYITTARERLSGGGLRTVYRIARREAAE